MFVDTIGLREFRANSRVRFRATPLKLTNNTTQEISIYKLEAIAGFAKTTRNNCRRLQNTYAIIT